MLNFDYQNKTRIIFGKGTPAEVGAHLKPLAKKVLLHYGGGSVKKNGLYDTVTASLKAAGVAFVELGGVVPNPRLSLVYKGIELCRSEGVDFILALGGGSVIDSAKAIAAGVPDKGDVWDFYEKKRGFSTALPVATILTIPAAGSESSPGSVVTNEKTGRKLAIIGDCLTPVFSIVDPSLFVSLPPEQIANGVCDMMSHIMERYFTPTAHTEVIDGLCESTLRTIMRNARRLKKDRADYDAWAEIALAGTLAHNGLMGLGRIGDWASHAMEHELSARYDIAHGAGLAIVTPAWMKHVCPAHTGNFAQFAVNVMGIDGSLRDQTAVAAEGIAALEAFFADIGLPTRLRQAGIDGAHLEEMAQRATGFAFGTENPLGGLQKIRWQDVLSIYHAALD